MLGANFADEIVSSEDVSLHLKKFNLAMEGKHRFISQYDSKWLPMCDVFSPRDQTYYFNT